MLRPPSGYCPLGQGESRGTRSRRVPPLQPLLLPLLALLLLQTHRTCGFLCPTASRHHSPSPLLSPIQTKCWHTHLALLLLSPEPHRPFLPLAQPRRSSPRAELLRGCPAPRGGAPLQGQKGASPQAGALPEEADKRSSESDLPAQLRFNGFRGTPGAARIRIVSGILVSRQSMICCSSSCMPGVWNRSSCQRQWCRRRARTSHTFLTEAEAHGDSRVGAGSPAGASSRGEKPCPANTPLELISRWRPHPSPGGKRA